MIMNTSSSSTFSCSGQEDVWYQILEWLTPIEWCHLQATSRFHFQLLQTWFQRYEALTKEHCGGGGMSMAWTAKERVCRYYQARHFLFVQKTAEVTPEPPNKAPENLLGSEYFVEITQTTTTTTAQDASKNHGIIIWSGFLPATCTSLRMEAIQDHITRVARDANQNGRSSHWEESIDLLQHWDTKANDFDNNISSSSSSPRALAEWNQKRLLFCQNYRISIVQVAWPPSLAMQMLVLPTALQVHVDDREHHRETADSSMNYLNDLQQAAQLANQRRQQLEQQGGPRLPPSIHVWIESSPHQPSRFTELRIVC